MNQKKTEQLERQFTLDTVIPLLKALGFQSVRYTHAADEYGRDLVFYDSDRFGFQRLFCGQVKSGNLSGSASGTLNTIIGQIEDGMQMPFFDPSLNEEKFPAGFYLIISGEYTRNAREKIRERCRGKPVYFLDGKALETATQKIASAKIEEAHKETTHLVRGARAAMRCTPPDLKQFENLINQIDLIDGISGIEKVKALSEIGLEVTLNSAEGTRLLVDELMFVIVGWNEHPQIAKLISAKEAEDLLDLVAANLWDWGVQAVEYQRKPEPVKICADSLNAVLKVARKLEFKKPINTCISGINAMYQAAVRDRLDELITLVDEYRSSLFKRAPAAR